MSTTNRLTALSAKALGPGFHCDGAGLYLRVSESRKNWVYVYHWLGRRREMGLGGFADTSLAEARAKASSARALVRSGIDPLKEKAGAQTTVPTFHMVSEDFIALKGAAWRNPKHRQQWANTLRDYAKPLAEKPVDAISTSDVLSCLEPIWRTKPETAARVRMRIENVLDAAKARGFRSGENPAAWKGNLSHLLPPRSKLTRGHQRALDYRLVPGFVRALQQREGVAARALEFTILNAVRTSETLNAKWSEVDWEAKVWTIPASRTKTATTLRVPLTEPALAVLTEVKSLQSEWVFANLSLRNPLSINAMRGVLIRMGVDGETTVHGFRSSFRDWAGEATEFPRELVEMALGHQVGSSVERAYRRGDALERRRLVMEGWAAYLRDHIPVNGPSAARG